MELKLGLARPAQFTIVDPGNCSSFYFDYDKRKCALNVLYGPNVD